MWHRFMAVVSAVVILGPVSPAAAQAPPQPESYDRTLPTGDTVRVSRGNVVDVTPAGGRTPAFSVSQSGGRLYVVPDDAADPDPERFRVAGAPRQQVRSGDDGDVTIRVTAIGRDGRPARGELNVLNVVDGTRGTSTRELPGDPGVPCTDAIWDRSGCVRVPPGTYSVLGIVNTMPPWQDSLTRGTPLNRSFVGYPEITITEDTQLVFDARKATEVQVETPEHVTKRNTGAASHLMWSRTPQTGPAVYQGLAIAPGAQLEERLFLQPTEQVRTGGFEVYTRWRLEAPAITMSEPGVRLDPEYYHPSWFSDYSWQYPRLDGTVRLPVADAGEGRASDLAGRDLRGRLAVIRRADGISVAEQSNNAAAAGARMVAIYGPNDSPGGPAVMLKVPTVSLPHEQGRALLAHHPQPVAATGITRSPYLYELVLPETGRVPGTLRYVAHTRDLARVDNDFHGGGVPMSGGRAHWRPGETFSVATTYPLTEAPRARTDYLTAGPDTTWRAYTSAPEPAYANQFPHEQTPELTLTQPGARAYRPGTRQPWTWGKAPLVPAPSTLRPMARNGDRVSLWMGVVDAAGNFSNAFTSTFPTGLTTDLRVYRGDELIAQTPHQPQGTLALPPEDSAYRIDFDVANNAPWARLSTRTRSTWTFRSARTTGEEALPLLTVGYDAPLDLRNQASSGTLRLTARHQDGPASLRSLTLDVSYDDGATWTATHPRRTGDGYVAALDGTGFVSLRLRAEDTAGNTVSQETIRAYEIR